ncbi:MAG: shikimate kinase [Chloroflexota bacterium]|nr:shikimate kinase [Chloroflexota bacterium]
MKTDILLIGPVAAGKTTIAAILGKRLKLPVTSVDVLRWDYFREIGYDTDAAKQQHEQAGLAGLVAYWKPFEAHTAERILQDFSDTVIEFGGGYTVQDDPDLAARVKTAFAPYANVVLLLPSPDADGSIRVLRARLEAQFADESEPLDPALLALNETFVRHPGNAALATITIYTQHQTPEQTADAILARVQR